MTEENVQQDDPLWRYAVGLYRQPGCAALCLQLQNDFGASVNRLIFALWLAQSQRTLPAAAAMLEADQWQQTFLIPLRSLRYQLRESVTNDTEAACYEVFKQAELEAEKVELRRLQQLFDYSPEAPHSETQRLDNLNCCFDAGAQQNEQLQQCLLQLSEIARQYGSN